MVIKFDGEIFGKVSYTYYLRTSGINEVENNLKSQGRNGGEQF